MIEGLFNAIDRKDAQDFGLYLTDDCTFRFGNQDAVTGKSNVVKYVSGFFDSIKSLSHHLTDTYEVDGAIICYGFVTYTRHNGSTLRVPFANVFKMAETKVREYLIFVDTSTLYS